MACGQSNTQMEPIYARDVCTWSLTETNSPLQLDTMEFQFLNPSSSNAQKLSSNTKLSLVVPFVNNNKKKSVLPGRKIKRLNAIMVCNLILPSSYASEHTFKVYMCFARTSGLLPFNNDFLFHWKHFFVRLLNLPNGSMVHPVTHTLLYLLVYVPVIKLYCHIDISRQQA